VFCPTRKCRCRLIFLVRYSDHEVPFLHVKPLLINPNLTRPTQLSHHRGTEDSEKATACNRHVNTFQRSDKRARLFSRCVLHVPRLRLGLRRCLKFQEHGNRLVLTQRLCERSCFCVFAQELTRSGLTMPKHRGRFETEISEDKLGLASEYGPRTPILSEPLLSCRSC